MMRSNVHIYFRNRHYDKEEHCFDGYESVKPVTVGYSTWIGHGCIILLGVSIRDNCIVGAGSVVTKNISLGVVDAGNPCIIRRIIDKEVYRKNEDTTYKL